MVLFLVYSQVDGFVVISEKLAELVARYKKKSAQFIKIPILVDDHENSEDAETVLKTNGFPYILHAGALSETKDGVLAVFKAFVKVNQSQALDFYLTSNSMQPSLANQVNQLIKHYKLEHRVHFTGFLETGELTKLRKNSALAIINKPLNWQNKYNFPTKLAEYLMDEVPLIVSEGGEMSHFLENQKNALIVSANNVDQIAASMLQILDDPQQAARIGEAGKALAKRVFYYRNYRATLGEFYRYLANKN
jgi:glycosyltransferase involved in cell wall biosynthesis